MTGADRRRQATGKSRPRKQRPPMPPGREARPPKAQRVDVVLADPAVGRPIVWASYAGTAALGVTAVAAAVDPGTFDVTALLVALALFFGGTAVFIWAFLTAVGRSRTDDISLSGVFGLAGSTPPPVRVRLFASLAAEVVIAVATAGTRLYSTLSFGVLAVMWGLGAAGLWGARYGAFPPRVIAGRPTRRRPSRQVP